MGSITAYELGLLYSKLPLGKEFAAHQFAKNPDESRHIGKMLTKLENAGLLISKNGHRNKIYEAPEKVVRDGHNSRILRCLNNILMQNAQQFTYPKPELWHTKELRTTREENKYHGRTLSRL